MTEKGQPHVETVTVVTKRVQLVMTGDQVREALIAYLNRKFPSFRGMEVEFTIVDEDDLEIQALAEDIKETRPKVTLKGRSDGRNPDILSEETPVETEGWAYQDGSNSRNP